MDVLISSQKLILLIHSPTGVCDVFYVEIKPAVSDLFGIKNQRKGHYWLSCLKQNQYQKLLNPKVFCI